MKLTGVAKSSQEELRMDYQAYLRQRNLEEWPPNHPALMRFKAKRCATLAEVQAWVKEERRIARTNTDQHRPTQTGTSVPVRARSTAANRGQPCRSVPAEGSPCLSVPSSAQLVANAALSLLNLTRNLLKNQLAAQAAAFENEGGFTERLYRIRTQNRKSPAPASGRNQEKTVSRQAAKNAKRNPL
jgi:four helix bundle suffix protein